MTYNPIVEKGSMNIRSKAKKLIGHYFNTSPVLFRLMLLFFAAYFLNYYSEILFHITFEITSALFAISVFLLAWNARTIIRNNFLLNLSIGFLFVGILDFAYALSPTDIGIFRGYDHNLEGQLWIASRYVLAITFLASLLFVNRPLNYFRALFFATSGLVLILVSIFVLRTFPVIYTAQGLSHFYTTSEIVITVTVLTSLVLLRRNEEFFDKRILTLLTVSFVVSAMTDTIFYFSDSTTGPLHLLGHSLKVLSYYYVYKAIVEVGLSEPYKLLFLEIEKRNERKDELLSVASHEIKSPVTSIVLYSQLLEEKLQHNFGNAELAQKINRQANKVSRLVNDLLDLSKIESNEILFSFRYFDLEKLIREVVEKQRQIDDTHTITYDNLIEDKIYGDKEKIEQVLENLVSNASKYSPPNTQIKIKASKTENFITISVEDKGIGIPQASYGEIFKKFYRTDISLNKAEGLGIGLYISKNIIEKHKGHMWFKSEEGKGSIFYFSLPVVVSLTKINNSVMHQES